MAAVSDIALATYVDPQYQYTIWLGLDRSRQFRYGMDQRVAQTPASQWYGPMHNFAFVLLTGWDSFGIRPAEWQYEETLSYAGMLRHFGEKRRELLHGVIADIAATRLPAMDAAESRQVIMDLVQSVHDQGAG
jgi:hypothetical protein